MAMHRNLAADDPNDELAELALTHDDAAAGHRFYARGADCLRNVIFAEAELGMQRAQALLHPQRIRFSEAGCSQLLSVAQLPRGRCGAFLL